MRKLVISSAILILTLLSIPSALANSLVSTSPISGSTVTTSPSAVTITTQIVLSDMGNTVVVTDKKGTRVDDGSLIVDGMGVLIGLQSLVDSGLYTVTYSLLSDADAPLEGSFTFTYSAPAEISAPSIAPSTSNSSSPENGGSTSATSIFVIVLLFLAFVVLVSLSLYARKIFKGK